MAQLPPIAQISKGYQGVVTVQISRDGFRTSLLETTTDRVVSFQNSDIRSHSLIIQGNTVQVLAGSMTGYRFVKGGVYDVIDDTARSKILIMVQ